MTDDDNVIKLPVIRVERAMTNYEAARNVWDEDVALAIAGDKDAFERLKENAATLLVAARKACQ